MSTNTLREMLTYCRPHGSKMDRVFREQFLLSLPGAYIDEGRNIHVHVSDDPILWSSHTDTVHWQSGRQRVILTDGWFKLPEGSKSHCLGADDTVGCYIMREMIKARVKGHYVFHYGEESGCIGSRWLATHYADWLKTFTMAIALDRAGYSDVISHQCGMRCASKEFVNALAASLPGAWESDHGVYTDTAEYADLIPECTNLSVGYFRQHSQHETVNIDHVFRLTEALIGLDLTDFPVKRDPSKWDSGWDDYAGYPDVAYGVGWSIHYPKSYEGKRRLSDPLVTDSSRFDGLDKPVVNRDAVVSQYLRRAVLQDAQKDLQSTLRRRLSETGPDTTQAITLSMNDDDRVSHPDPYDEELGILEGDLTGEQFYRAFGQMDERKRY